LLDPAQTVLLYGTTPPRLGTPDEQVSAAAGKLAARLAALPLDGVVVYDIQDETGRTQLPRPFPFMRTIDPRQYSRQLMQSTRLPAITYKALGNLDEAGWRSWLSQSQGIEFISVVGRPVSGVRYALPLSRAIRIAASDAGGFTIGGVVIAERHTERASLGAADPLAKSIEICRDNLRRILDEPYAGEIPLGVNVESVSINRDEIDAGIELFHALREVLAGK